MHSRIFQLTTRPLTGAEYISESDFFEHWFFGSIADGIHEDTNRDADIEWLKRKAKGYSVASDARGVFLEVYSKEEYFKTSYERFSKALEKVQNCTLTEFANGLEGMYDIKDAYEDRFDFYVCGEFSEELETFDGFIRGAEIGVKYYVGGTLDYHY